MTFSSLTFTTLFFPVVLILYFICTDLRWRNGVLLVASLIFYSWGESVWVLAMIGSTAINYSGYSDIVIGMGRILRPKLPKIKKLRRAEKFCPPEFLSNSAQTLEEAAQELRALIAEDTGIYLRMVPVVFKEEVDNAAAGACDGIARAEDKAWNAGVYYRAGTHRAGFERHIHRAALKTPAAERGSGLADGFDLGVGGRVAKLLTAVASAAYDAAFDVHDHAADRHLAVLRRLARKVKGEGHIFFVRHGDASGIKMAHRTAVRLKLSKE